MPRAVAAFLHQGLVEFSASTRVNSSPAIFTVILQTGNISTEKWSKFPSATGPLTFITQLVIQDIWLNLHLHWRDNGESAFQYHVQVSTLLCCASTFLCQKVPQEGAVMHFTHRNEDWPFQIAFHKIVVTTILHANHVKIKFQTKKDKKNYIKNYHY